MARQKSNPRSFVMGDNPKDALGIQKASVSFIPQASILHCARAMMHGAAKYGKFNWRAKKVTGSIYVDAGFRHRALWLEGQELDEESGCHHLAHSMACDAILLDAIETGNLLDDRAIADEAQARVVLERLRAVIGG